MFGISVGFGFGSGFGSVRFGLVWFCLGLGVRPLAYRMRAHMKWNTMGRYIRFFLQISPHTLKEIEHRLKIDEEVVRYMPLKRDIAPDRKEKPLKWRNDNIFPAAEMAFHQKYSHLDYFAARELLRRGTLTPEQVLANDFSAVPKHAPAQSGSDKAAASAMALADAKSKQPKTTATAADTAAATTAPSPAAPAAPETDKPK